MTGQTDSFNSSTASLPEDLSIENGLCEAFENEPKSITVESNVEDAFVVVPKNLTFAEIVDILNKAINEDNYEELEKIIENIQSCENISVVGLDSQSFLQFCSQQLNLDLQGRSDHQHIYSNILRGYKLDTNSYNNNYSVKELVLLAIAANDELTKKYNSVLFSQENLSLLPLLVGGQRYIEIFTEKFHEIYTNLKEQIITIPSGQVNFFSVIALRNEQAFLQAVLVEYVLKDLIETLQISPSDPLYGVFETASLAKNEPFITMVLDIFEKRADDEIKKDLLVRSIVNLLEAAMSQEHVSIVEYLCQRYVRSANSATYSIYEQAFADDGVISVLKEQILKNINARSRRKIYDLILKITLDSGNIGFIERLCEKCPECSNDVVNHLDQKLKNNELDDIYESILLMCSNSSNRDLIISVLAHIQVSDKLAQQAIQNILRSAIEQADDMVIGLLHISVDLQTPTIQKIYIKECKKALPIVEEKLEKTSQLLVKKPEVGWGIVNMIPFFGETREEVFADITVAEYFKITGIMSSLYRIRGFLQNNTNIQAENVLETKEESHIVEDKLQKKSNGEKRNKASKNLPTIPEEEPEEFEELENNIALSGQEPTEDNSNDFLTNNCEEGKMFNNINDIEAGLLGAIQTIDFKQVQRWVKEKGAIVNENVLNKANERLNVLKDSQSTKNKKNSKTQQIKNMGEIIEFLQQVHGKLQSSVMLDVEDQSSDSGRGSASASGCTTPVSDDNQEAQQLVQQEQAMIEIDNSGSQKTTQQTSRNSFLQPLVENQPQQEASTKTAASDAQVVLSRKAQRKVRQAAQKQSQLGANDNPSSDKGADDSSILRVLIDNYDKNTGKRTIKYNNGSTATIQDVVHQEEPVVWKGGKSNSNQQNTQPKTLATNHEPNGVIAENDNIEIPVSEQANDTHGDNEQHSDPEETETTSKSAQKSKKWPTIAISTLTVAAVASVALSIYFEMLMIGLAVGACCLVAAAIVYCCKPASLLEDSNAKASANSVPVVQ